uniref:Uncharacterized protein n=1 Tax=Cacopsylla melanoneura TaxID=428564 RepID=A0A8D8RWS0_9HEMI
MRSRTVCETLVRLQVEQLAVVLAADVGPGTENVKMNKNKSRLLWRSITIKLASSFVHTSPRLTSLAFDQTNQAVGPTSAASTTANCSTCSLTSVSHTVR